jgi:cellulose synthase/poly-beta-1,6-N-acetylglucosamine synthase-like glycosyltransferase
MDIVVPEFNELSRQGERFEAQIEQFVRLADSYNVVLIDDASTDGSWEKIQEVTSRFSSRGFHSVRMQKNGQKVLAVKRAVDSSKAEFIMLTDFDSRIANPEGLAAVLEGFDSNPLLASVCLRVVPRGDSTFSRLQDIEYAMGRKICGAYMSPKGKLRCVSGAAGIWRRKVLVEVLLEHSGRHNGDDMEATAIAMRKGYQVRYDPSVVVETLVPQGFLDLLKQRKRWGLGALETYDKERKFYASQVRNLKDRLGQVTIIDWYSWASCMLFPLLVLNGIRTPILIPIYACIELSTCAFLGYISRDEIRDKRNLLLTPLLPFYRIFVSFVPFTTATLEFARAKLASDSHQLRLGPPADMYGIYLSLPKSAPPLGRIDSVNVTATQGALLWRLRSV